MKVTILIFASYPSTVHVLRLGEEFDESVHSRSSDFFECMYIGSVWIELIVAENLKLKTEN